MILRFRHKGLGKLYAAADTSGVSAQHVKRLRVIDDKNVTNVDPVDYH
jgi:plasmid maintenance system killer protein